MIEKRTTSFISKIQNGIKRRTSGSVMDLQRKEDFAETSLSNIEDISQSTAMSIFSVDPDIRRAQTEAHFSQRFPDLNEKLMEYHSCAYEKDILWHGRLYITAKGLYFYSKLFGTETKLAVQFDQITAIEKSCVAFIPTAITVHTKEGKHLFASFMKRDGVYEFLQQSIGNALEIGASPEATVLKTAIDSSQRLNSPIGQRNRDQTNRILLILLIATIVIGTLYWARLALKEPFKIGEEIDLLKVQIHKSHLKAKSLQRIIGSSLEDISDLIS